MLTEILNAVYLYGTLFLSLFLVDYTLGNGFVDIIEKVFSNFVCFVKKTVREEAKHHHVQETSISLPVLFGELLFLGVTIICLNKYKEYRGKDRIDDLLQESREALERTNKYLEKWRLRRLNYQASSEHSCLDQEPQKIEPIEIEVPILHMAIIDGLVDSMRGIHETNNLALKSSNAYEFTHHQSKGTTRSQLERGDAGDTINITDSTLLSVTSFLDDDDLDSLAELPSEEKLEVPKFMEFGNRYLWDVMEEDMNNLEE